MWSRKLYANLRAAYISPHWYNHDLIIFSNLHIINCIMTEIISVKHSNKNLWIHEIYKPKIHSGRDHAMKSSEISDPKWHQRIQETVMSKHRIQVKIEKMIYNEVRAKSTL